MKTWRPWSIEAFQLRPIDINNAIFSSNYCFCAGFGQLSDYYFKIVTSGVLPANEFKHSYFQFLNYSSTEDHCVWILEYSFPTFKVVYEMGDLRLL